MKTMVYIACSPDWLVNIPNLTGDNYGFHAFPGRGIPLFGGTSRELNFQLTETRRLNDSMTASRYIRKRERALSSGVLKKTL